MSPRWLVRSLLLAALLAAASAARAAEIPLDTLRHGDRVRIELSHGGEVEGHAVARVGERLELRTDDGGLIEVDPALVLRLEVVGGGGTQPLPSKFDVAALTDDDLRRARARARRRADGYAIGSFFVPGSGQLALGKRGVGSLYLIGTLVIDASIVATLVINHDPLIAVILGALDVAARVSSATLARRDALELSLVVAPVPAPGGVGVVARLGLLRW